MFGTHTYAYTFRPRTTKVRTVTRDGPNGPEADDTRQRNFALWSNKMTEILHTVDVTVAVDVKFVFVTAIPY